MKESDLFSKIANDIMRMEGQIRSYVAEVVAKLRPSEERTSLERTLSGLRKEALNVAGRAMHGAEMRLIDGDSEVVEVAEQRATIANPFSILLQNLGLQEPNGATTGCRCSDCEMKRQQKAEKAAETQAEPAPAESNGHTKYETGEAIEFRFGNTLESTAWSPGSFRGHSANVSGSLIVRDDQGRDYLIAPENVRSMAEKAAEVPI